MSPENEREPGAAAGVVRRATAADLPALLDLERRSFATPWPEGAFARELELPQAEVWLVEDHGGDVVGYVDLWLLEGEVEILNVAVDPQRRRGGIGRALLDKVRERLDEHDAEAVFLEVRRGNEAAIGLYRACGFHQVGLRKRYYQDNGEDAVLMSWARTWEEAPGA